MSMNSNGPDKSGENCTAGVPAKAFERILFFTDFSESSDRAFGYALDLATKNPGAELFLLHVVPESESQFWKTYIYEVDDVDTKAKSDINHKIEEAYLSRKPEQIQMNVHFRVGKDVQEILDFAQEQRIDLIVLARQGSSSLENAFFGSVSEKVVKKAHCPVLVVPKE